MKLSFILVSFLVAFTFLNQSFAEVYTTGSAADNNGNITVIGYCLGNVAIGGEQFNISTPSAFILKLNSDGEKIWVRFINSTQSIKANAVAVDSSGNIYITGEFSGTANFDTYFLTSQRINAFIVRYNSQGNAEWVKRGSSSNYFDASGNDIFVKGDFVYTCGYGKPITFDSLTITGGGYTVVYNQLGAIQYLFNTTDNAYSLNIDGANNIVIIGGYYVGPPYPSPYYITTIAKFTPDGTLLFNNYLYNLTSICTDFTQNIFCSSKYGSVYLDKLDTTGNLLIRNNLGTQTSFRGNKLSYSNDGGIIFCGYYSSNFIFGDSIYTTEGSTDAFIAKLDTSLNPIWIKHGGGLYDDELISSSNLIDGSIISCGNFRGTIDLDTLQPSGGTGLDNEWVALLKFDNTGNLIWFKNIAEDIASSSLTNWFPLDVGNKWQFVKESQRYNPHWFTSSILDVSVSDSIYINNKKFFIMSNLVYLTSIPVRFDKEAQKIIIYYNNQEQTFMDFNQSDGTVFEQILENGIPRQVTVVSQNIIILNDTLNSKGFYYANSWETGLYLFVPELGFVYQEENALNSGWPYQGTVIDLKLLEYLIFDQTWIRHQKHTYSADIQFQPITFLPDIPLLTQEFIIDHQYSVLSGTSLTGVSYINKSYFESYYYNGIDTISQTNRSITQINQKTFSLSVSLDTNLYNQGYHLYYRIAAVDKGIVADTFYSPQTGYYKLFWKDSTTSVTQTEFEALTYSLSQNYPNPFNPVSKIVFTIPKRENVSLKVYDILGSEVETLVNKELEAGKYEVEFSGKELSSGIYIYQIKAGAFREIKKMILMR
jgi:hypothetical protein